jgi:hypothetical protein
LKSKGRRSARRCRRRCASPTSPSRMKHLTTIGLACIVLACATFAYWNVTIQQLNDAPPVPSERIPDWRTLWRDYPFFASGLLISGSRPFSGQPNDIDHISTTYLSIVTLRDRARLASWIALGGGMILIGFAVREKRRSKDKPSLERTS